MDINQAAKMIEWLDEERRRDKQLIIQLQEQLSSQEETIHTLTRRLGTVESDQTVLQTKVDHDALPTEGAIMDQVRGELRNMLENVEAKRLTAEREADKRNDIAREGVLRSVRDLTERISTLELMLGEIPGFQLERERTGEAVAAIQQSLEDLSKKLEEPERRLSFLEEQRRQDTRRLSEIQSEIPEIQKQIDTLRPKQALIEELALRNERKVNEVQTTESERRDQIQQFIDQQSLLLQQRDQQVNALTERFGEQDSLMQRNLERFEGWAETHRAMKRIIDDFERIGDRLERRINEVAEMQRLSEERFRQEWNDWRTDDQKRWKQFTLSNDEVWRTHDKTFERTVNHMSEIESLIPPLQESINRLWQLERDRAELYRERYQTMLMEHDTGSTLTKTSTSTMPAVKTSTFQAINGSDDTE